MTKLANTYETDYWLWTQHNIKLLRQGKLNKIDIEHIIEELEDMGKSTRRELASRLIVLLAHLLKWQYQLKHLSELHSEFQGNSWRSSINEQRKQLERLLRDNPSLKKQMPDTITEIWKDSVDLAHQDTGLSLDTFPTECPYQLTQVFEITWFPETE